jgi:hypothetical protein
VTGQHTKRRGRWEEEEATPRACISASAGQRRHHHRRHRRQSLGGGKLQGRLRVRGNPNRTPTPFMRRPSGSAEPTRPRWAVDRPAGPQAAHPPFPEVRRTPLNFRKVQKNPLNFNLALILLSFIYSDLLVLYIYDLDLELFCNFVL